MQAHSKATVRRTCNFPPELLDWIEAKAKREDRSTSKQIVAILRKAKELEEFGSVERN